MHGKAIGVVLDGVEQLETGHGVVVVVVQRPLISKRQ